MQAALAAWTRWGIRDTTPDDVARRVQVLNALASLITLCVLPYVPIFAYLSPVVGGLTAGAAALLVATLVLVRAGAFPWARALFVLVQPLILVAFALMFGPEVSVELMLLPCCVNFLILFAPREWPQAVASVSWVCGCYFAVVVSDHALLPVLPRIALPPGWVGPLRWTFAAITFSLLVTGVSYVSWLSGQAELRRRQAFEALLAEAELRRRADDASEAKSRFLANMSHELRTPLNAIIGYADLILEELADAGDPAGLQQDVGRIERAGRHLLAIVNDVLDLSKVEAGAAELHLEDVPLGPLVDELHAQLEPALVRQRDRFVAALPDGPLTVHTDRVKLKQILLNLLSNAVKFTTDGEVRVVVSVGEGQLRVAVYDTGVGIAPADQQRIFDAFVQADDAPTRAHQGTGLGLALSRRLATLLGGTLAVESALGQGSVFTLTLPLGAGPAA